MILWLAPMDGFTDTAMRLIVADIFARYGEKEKYELMLWTEFMTADGYHARPRGVMQHLLTVPHGTPTIAQIFGGNLETLLFTAGEIQKKYANIFTGIELNTWCPANNIMRSGWGSELLKDKKNLLHILQALSQQAELPLSIKTRTGVNEDDKEAQMEMLVDASPYCSMISVHGRTVKQGYGGDPDWEFIYELKRKSDKKCKIIGNGAIHSYQDIQAVKWDLDGVMIGQAAIGNPWIFTPHIPNNEEKKQVVLQHLDLMVSAFMWYQQPTTAGGDVLTMPGRDELDAICNEYIKTPEIVPSRPLTEFRKHLFSYVKGMTWSKERKVMVSQLTDYPTLVHAIQDFFG